MNEPGLGTSGKHYHQGHSFTWVIEGSEVYEVEGKPAKMVKAGDVLHEEPMQVPVPGDTPLCTSQISYIAASLKDAVADQCPVQPPHIKAASELAPQSLCGNINVSDATTGRRALIDSSATPISASSAGCRGDSADIVGFPRTAARR